MTVARSPQDPLIDVLFEDALVGRCLVAPDGTVLRVNAEWLRSTGYSAAQVLGEDIVGLFPGAREMALAIHARARAGEHVEVPRHVVEVNGRVTFWEGSIDPVPLSGGTGLLITAREVSGLGERDLLAAVVENTGASIAVLTGRDLVFTLVNSSYQAILPGTPMVGRPYADVFPEAAAFGTAERLRRVLVTGEPWNVERWAAPIPGKPDATWEGQITRLSGLPGQAHSVLVVVHDVTARERAQVERERLVTELDRSVRELEATFASIADGAILYGPGGQLRAMNAAAEEILGYTYAEWTAGRSLDQRAVAVHARTPDGTPLSADAVPTGRALRGETVRGLLMVLDRRDGLTRWVSASAAPVRGPDGAITGAIATFADVTERRRDDEALRESTSLLRAISDTSDDVIYAKDRSGRLRFANPATLALIGKPLGQVLGRTDAQLLEDPAAATQVMANDRRIMESGAAEELEERVPLPDGTVRIWLSRKSPSRDADGRVVGLLGISRDITDRKRSDDALRESQARYRALFENMTEEVHYWTVVRDAGGEIVTWRLLDLNPAAVRSWGRPLEEVQGKLADEIFPGATAQSLETVRRVFATGRAESHETYVPSLDRHSRLTTFAIGDDRFITTGADVTAVRKAQRVLEIRNEELREEARRREEFLAMLAHELRNPLAPIRNSSYILRHTQPGSAQARRSQEVIERQTQHLTRLVDDLLDVTRIARGKIELRRERVDLREVVARAADDVRFRMDENGVALGVAVPDARLWAEADPTRVAQVVGNLLHNAWKFTRRGDAVEVSLAAVNGFGEIRVRDTGAGIDPGLLPRIFEPFVQADHSLARTQGGLGLGLALVKGIVELHGGSVRVESVGRGAGAVFIVRLPLVAAAVSGAARRSTGPFASGGRRVLVVDDNRDAAESLADLVTMLGHSAEVAFDGETAIERARATAPDVVLCDIGLPGTSGYDVARAIRAQGRPVQLIAVSGYTQPDDVRRAAEAGFDAHVAKPPDIGALERLLASPDPARPSSPEAGPPLEERRWDG